MRTKATTASNRDGVVVSARPPIRTTIARVQKPLLADPALLVDKDAVHHGNLPGRTAERQHGEAPPNPESVTKRDEA